MKVIKKAACKGGFLFILLALFFTIGLPFFSYADSIKPIEKAPINRDFHDFLNNRSLIIADDGHSLGEIPSPVDLSHVRGKIDRRVGIERAPIPGSYDLRTTGKLTPVKDQGACGSCWTFGTYASLESFLKPIETWDFYEDHLNRNHGFDIPACEGGNTYMALAYLARWSGPLDETNPTNLAPQKHIQQAVLLPTRTNFTDNDTIKNFVMAYGAVKASFYYSAAYWKASTNSYYNDSDTTTNHAVAVVGWDDGYLSTNFDTAPPGNGAFIMKNSWGSSWGENGYFYISYYDTSLKSFASFNNAEAVSNYKAVYQYDPLGWVGNYGGSSTTGWGANIFTATGRHAIAAVGFYTNDANTAYSIYVYKGVTAGQPTSGTLAATKTGTNIYPGYYTVKLDAPISLNNGENFSIVIKFVNTAYMYPVPQEYIEPLYSSAATSHTGESFFSSDGTTWNDLYDATYKTNNTIKAFIVTQTISGTITSGGSPLSGVVMNNLPGNPTTNASGFYSVEVDYNWSGTVTPIRAGYDFTPSNWVYTNVTTDQLNQDYTATLLTYAISGTVRISGVTPLAGVVMNGLPGTTTDINGFYLSTITYNGATVTPTLSGYTFTPTSRPYTNVIANQPNQDYTATVSSGGSSIGGGGGGGGGGGCFIAVTAQPGSWSGLDWTVGKINLAFLILLSSFFGLLAWHEIRLGKTCKN